MIRLSLPKLRFYFSFYEFFCSNVNTINKSMISHYISVIFFCVSITCRSSRPYVFCKKDVHRIFSVIWLGKIRLKSSVIVLRLIWEFRWYKEKANRRTEILFLLLTLLTIYPYMFQSDSFWLEQSKTHYDCFKKVSVQFLSTVTNWKGGTLDKSLFILELGKIAVQFHPPTTEFFSYLV